MNYTMQTASLLAKSKAAQPNIYFYVILMLLCYSTSCSSSHEHDIVQQAVVNFHRELDQQEWTISYDSADDEFRHSGTKAEFSNFLQTIHNKLGNVQQAEIRSYKKQWIAGRGSFISTVFETQFTFGKAIETFSWHIVSNRAVLHGYNINSNALIVK